MQTGPDLVAGADGIPGRFILPDRGEPIPAQKMGFYIGVSNFVIVIPQSPASLGLGALMKSFLGDNPLNAILLEGCAMAVAALCIGFVPAEVYRVDEQEAAEDLAEQTVA